MFDIFDLTCPFDHALHLNRLRQFGVFCNVNSTSYGPCPLKDGRDSDRPRQRIFSGIHCRCHTDKACPPPSSKKKEESCFLPHHMENCPKCSTSQVRPFVADTTCDLGSCVATQTLWLFDILVSAVWQVSVTHALSFLSPNQQAYFLHHRLISIHQAPVVIEKLHLNLQYFLCVFQAAAVSHINTRHALRQTKLNWSTL